MKPMKYEILCKCGKKLIVISEYKPDKHFYCGKCRRAENLKNLNFIVEHKK